MFEKTSQNDAITTDHSRAENMTKQVKTACSKGLIMPASTSPPEAPETSMIIQSEQSEARAREAARGAQRISASEHAVQRGCALSPVCVTVRSYLDAQKHTSHC